jgi:hypothetical protein
VKPQLLIQGDKHVSQIVRITIAVGEEGSTVQDVGFTGAVASFEAPPPPQLSDGGEAGGGADLGVAAPPQLELDAALPAERGDSSVPQVPETESSANGPEDYSAS